GAGRCCGVTPPAATRGGDRAGPPRSLGGSYTHRPILNHEGGAESPPALSRKGSVVRNNFQSIKSRACVSHIFVASPDTRRRACPLSSKDPGRQRARRAHRPALSPPSLYARDCLLPAVLCVRRIPYRAMTGATH